MRKQYLHMVWYKNKIDTEEAKSRNKTRQGHLPF